MKLNDIAEINPKTDVSHLDDDALVSFIPMSDLSDDGRWLGRDSRKLSSVRQGYTAFAENDVLFAKITPCMENGKGARLSKLINAVGFGSTEYHVLRARSEDDGEYVFQWSKFGELRQQAANAMTGSAGQQRVPADFLRGYPIFGHSPLERPVVGEVLLKVDRAIEQTEALLAKQQRIKAGLVHDLLTRGLDPQGRFRDSLTHRFKPSLLGPIPEEWNVSSFESQKGPHRAFIRTGPFGTAIKQSDWRESGVPVITIGSLGDGKFDKSALQYLSEEKAEELAVYRVEAGDLLFSRVADVGRAIVVTKNEQGWLMSSNLMRISLDLTKTVPALVHLMLLHQRTAEQTRRSINSSGRDVANTAILSALQFAWPLFDEQSRIANAMAVHTQTAQHLTEQMAKLYRVKAGLMHDLLNGHVSVAPLLTNHNPFVSP